VPMGCAFGDLSSSTSVALFGDSHAAQWFPPLDELGRQYGFRLDSYTKSSCPAADVTMITDGVEDTACAAWRTAVLSELEASPPALVIIAGFSRYAEYGTSSVDIATWNAGLAATLAALPAPTRVLVISDTPAFTETPSTCLSVHVSDAAACSRSRDEAIASRWIRAEARTAHAAGAAVTDVNDYLCDAQTCGLIVGDRLLYRDPHHLTASFATLLAPQLWVAMEPLIDR